MSTPKFLIVIAVILLYLCLKSPVYALEFGHKPDSIQLVYDNQQLILPGESFRIGVVSYFKNGKIKKTIGLSGGTVFWWNYKVEVLGGNNFLGNVTVNEKLLPSKGKYIEVAAYPRKQPQQIKSLLLPLNYETKIEFKPTNSFDKAPGSSVQGEVIAQFDNGMTHVYSDLRNQRESKAFNFKTDGGAWGKGRFTIEPNIERIVNHQSNLVVSSLRNTEAADTFSILLDYKHDYRFALYGSGGSFGFTGLSGSNGSTGYDGQDGGPGGNGEFGEDGPDIGVWTDLYFDSVLQCNLLYVYAENLWTGKEYRYLINPDGGSLQVSSTGGSGGPGGSGGSGGNGGNGADGEKWIEQHIEKRIVKKPVIKQVTKKEKRTKTDVDGKEVEYEVDVIVDITVYVDEEIDVVVDVVKQGPGYDGGNGGWGGPGGLGGYGGNITLYFTDDAMPFRHLITASSEGGSGGIHGSGGWGGSGGHGGSGNPNGRSGTSGSSGPSAIGWADSGRSGTIHIESTEDFFYYELKE